MSRASRVASLLLPLAAACGNIDEYPYADCPSNGVENCPCRSSGRCDTRADGTRLVCLDDVCRVPDCGGEGGLAVGCSCGGAGTCGAGLICLNGACVADTGQSLVPPGSPKCYTPCRGGYVAADGQFVPCSEQGLLAGCIGGAICDRGTCVVPRSSTRGALTSSSALSSPETGTCNQAADCADFQTCIDHRCYSDCERDVDCREGRQCVKMVCRLPCMTDAVDACPAGEFCSTKDGQAGFCTALADSDAPGEPPLAGTFSLSAERLEMSNTQDTASFRIVNNTPAFLDFTVTKLSHTEFTDEGPVVVTEYPLHWLLLGSETTTPAQVQELVVGVEGNGGIAEIRLAGADNPTLSRWEAVLQISNHRLGEQTVRLSYAQSPEGQWAGRVYYFANFGTLGLDAWLADRSNRDKLSVVGNAFLRRWGALRDSRISVDEFRAMLNATLTESWRWPSVEARCPNETSPNPNAACYLYDNAVGLSVYSDYLPDNPIPTGMVDFPIVLNLRAVDAQTAPGVWQGKIVSSESLQYAGDPAVELVFGGNPMNCTSSAGGACVTLLESFGAEVFVGGRYETTPADVTCHRAASGTFKHQAFPWLVPGFEADTEVGSDGHRYRYECRDKLLPFGDLQSRHALNISLAASNPIPDGATRRRQIELVDGALIDQETLFIIFREQFPSFLDTNDTEGFSAYGVMELVRSPATLTDDDYRGAAPADVRVPPGIAGVGCDADLLADLFPTSRFYGDPVYGPIPSTGVTAATAGIVAETVIEGTVPTGGAPPVIDGAHAEKVHYYCEDTDLFDGGPQDYDDPLSPGWQRVRVACPPGSRVEYFTLQGGGAGQESIANLPCQVVCADQACIDAKATKCSSTLASWKVNGTHAIRWNVIWRCADPDAVYCDADRLDLRAGKVFYGEEVIEAVARPVDLEIDDAFRYKTKFRNRSGKNIGFAPEMCIPNSDDVPYCYDPPAIEAIRDRVDCAAHLYTHFYQELTPATQVKLRDFLVRSFAYGEEFVFGLATPVIHDGFERLNAELLIMMGDEAYTSAFKSRFDLAGLSLASFKGSLFEPDGIDLSGGAGYEMFSLYLATQYYQTALDRFYKLSPVIWESIGELPPGQSFITQGTVTSYFSRLIRASAQKTRAASEIAKRYQGFNRPDLARLVVERAYTSAYLESIILSRLMLKVVDVASPSDKAQIEKEVENAQRIYRMALLDMRNVYTDIVDNLTFFGFDPDYIPFPALNPLDTNAFTAVMARALRKLEIAAEKEIIALADDRAFETDSALFQAELASLADEYETELGNICGTFAVNEGGDTVIYPAIPDYAHLHAKASLLGDPCGLMGNGELHGAIVELEVAKLDFESIKLAQKNLKEQIADLNAQLAEQCGRIHEFKNFYIGMQQGIIAAQTAVNALDAAINITDRWLGYTTDLIDYAGCTVGVATDCPTKAAVATTFGTIAAIGHTVATIAEIAKVPLQTTIAELEQGIAYEEIEQECEALTIDTKYAVKDLVRQATELHLETIKVQYGVQLAASQVEKLRHDATSLMAGQADATELLINVEAARNDPNVRIYRNDAILNADRTFQAAVREAYKATKVYEYYTSQSYAALDKLFLVRMVAHGDYSLESYLAELEEAFIEFEELYGLPDTRVQVISLRDDVLAIPRLGPDSTAYSEEQRTALLRQRIQDVTLLDPRGYIVMPFSTSLDRLSPLTRNHKILYLEAEVIGDDVGDQLGRIYVQQRGTGVVRRVDGDKSFYSFPERTAVVDTFFNGERAFSDAVYRNERLRDRPVVNTGWELVFNQKDEFVNDDILLSSLSDVRLYVYYTDFTEL